MSYLDNGWSITACLWQSIGMGMKYGAGIKNCTGMIHNHIQVIQPCKTLIRIINIYRQT